MFIDAMGRLGGSVVTVSTVITVTAMVSIYKLVNALTRDLISLANKTCLFVTPIVNTLNAFIANDSAGSGVLFNGLRAATTRGLRISPL